MTKPKIKKILIYGVLAVAAIGAGTYIFLIQREKAQFNQAEKEIDALFAQIIEKVGKPDQEKKEKSCDRPNLKFDKGPLSCSIDRYLLFSNKDASSATEILKKVSVLGNGNLRLGSAATTGVAFSDNIQRSGDQRFFQNLESHTTLSCNLSYTYPADEQNIFTVNSQGAIIIGLGCYSSAMVEHYPLRD